MFFALFIVQDDRKEKTGNCCHGDEDSKEGKSERKRIIKELRNTRLFKFKVTIKQKYCVDESSFCTEYFSFKASRKDIFIV